MEVFNTEENKMKTIVAALGKGDITRASHGMLDGQPVTYLTLKDKNVLDLVGNNPTVVSRGEKNGELWVAIPRATRLKDFSDSVVDKIQSHYTKV